MHSSLFIWPYSVHPGYQKIIVERCELELKQPAVQRVSSVQLVAPTHLFTFHLDLDIT
nr:MAG TPA: hypothetical protein [Caudoviricetes sp.]